VTEDTNLHSVRRLRMRGAVPPLLYSFYGVVLNEVKGRLCLCLREVCNWKFNHMIYLTGCTVSQPRRPQSK
jgi:hypothetical protein